MAEANPLQLSIQENRNLRKPYKCRSGNTHFKDILNTENIAQAYNLTDTRSEDFNPITKDEITRTILELKTKTAAGLDGIYNEHLKDSMQHLAGTWAKLFNKCLETIKITNSWRDSIIKLIYKGKRDIQCPDSYRGIALGNAIAKLYTKRINNRMTEEADHLIPEDQYGFQKGRSTLQAVANLHADIKDALRHKKGKLYSLH